MKQLSKKIDYGTWEALQPIRGDDGSGFDKGSHWSLMRPWSIKREGGFENKPYLSIQTEEVVKQGGGPATAYAYESNIFKLFLKIKDEKSWFLKI